MGQIFTQLASVARETGYPVIEVPGWRNHHHGAFSDHVGATVCHHTAGADPHQSSSNYPSLNAVRNGVPGLAGPLSNYGMGFDGTIYVISSGTCWHAGAGGWAGMRYNSQAIGIEAEDAGDGDWTAAQLDCYPRLCAVICQFLGVGANTVCGHKEWCEPPGRKIDPAGIHMPDFRSDVQWYLNNPNKIRKGGGAPAPAPAPEEDDDMRADEREMLVWIHSQLRDLAGNDDKKRRYIAPYDQDKKGNVARWLGTLFQSLWNQSFRNGKDLAEIRSILTAQNELIAQLSSDPSIDAGQIERILKTAVAENMPDSINVNGELTWEESDK